MSRIESVSYFCRCWILLLTTGRGSSLSRSHSFSAFQLLHPPFFSLALSLAHSVSLCLFFYLASPPRFPSPIPLLSSAGQSPRHPPLALGRPLASSVTRSKPAMGELLGRKVFKVFSQDFIVDQRYNVTKELGQGAYGIVWSVPRPLDRYVLFASMLTVFSQFRDRHSNRRRSRHQEGHQCVQQEDSGEARPEGDQAAAAFPRPSQRTPAPWLRSGRTGGLTGTQITCLYDMDIPRPDNFNETYLYEGEFR